MEKGIQLHQVNEHLCGAVCSIVQRKDTSWYICSDSKEFASIFDVTSELVCLIMRLIITHSFIHISGTAPPYH